MILLFVKHHICLIATMNIGFCRLIMVAYWK